MAEQNKTSSDNKAQLKEVPKKVLETKFYPKYESSIPEEITSSILKREELPNNLPNLGSSMIEDFIMENVKKGIIDPQTIAQLFINADMPSKIEKFAEELKLSSQKLDWDNIFTINDARKTQEKVIKEMEDMGMDQNQIGEIARMKVDIAESIGVSSLSNDLAYTSRLQAVRKALDYIAVFGNEFSLEEIIKALMTSTIGHELGHKIDAITPLAINNIAQDPKWKKNGDNWERKSERFAEYWGNVAIRGNERFEKIKGKEWLIHLGKTTELWKAFAIYNSSHDEKADLNGIFRAIDECTRGKFKNTNVLLNARRGMYGGNEIEYYASPYPRETVLSAVRINTVRN